MTEVDDMTLFLSNNSHESCFVNTITSTDEASPYIPPALRGFSFSCGYECVNQFYEFPRNPSVLFSPYWLKGGNDSYIHTQKNQIKINVKYIKIKEIACYVSFFEL